MSNERSQIKNREHAMKMLKSKLYQLEIEEKASSNWLKFVESKRKLAGEVKFVPMFSIRIPWLKITVQIQKPETLMRSWMEILIRY